MLRSRVAVSAVSMSHMQCALNTFWIKDDQGHLTPQVDPGSGEGGRQ